MRDRKSSYKIITTSAEREGSAKRDRLLPDFAPTALRRAQSQFKLGRNPSILRAFGGSHFLLTLFAMHLPRAVCFQLEPRAILESLYAANESGALDVTCSSNRTVAFAENWRAKMPARSLRVQPACTYCRQMKHKCDARDTYPASCTRCARRHIECVLDRGFRRTAKRE